jgi:hypothetical protein
MALPKGRNSAVALGLGAVVVAGGLSACVPTINVNVKLEPIYAKLDLNVRIQLDEDVKALVKQNPDLF